MKWFKSIDIVDYYGGTRASTAEIKKRELERFYTSTFDHSKFKDKTVILVVTYHHLPAIQMTMSSIMTVLKSRNDVFCVILDNDSDPKIQTYLRTLEHPQIDLNFIGKNVGKAIAANHYTQTYITTKNLPKLVISIDPDIWFSSRDFNRLLKAATALPKLGMLGMRFKPNNCNPEYNIFFPARRIKDKYGNIHRIRVPFMCTVAGPIFAVQGIVFRDRLHFRLFPKKFLATYGGDDSATYDALRKGLLNGYLEGTEVIHLRSGDQIAPELKAFETTGTLPAINPTDK